MPSVQGVDKPQPRLIATSDITFEMKQIVETDLLFGRDCIVTRFLDRATRWQPAALVKSRSAAALVAALDKSWVKLFGPMRELIVDGKTSLASEECAAYDMPDIS